MRSNRKIPFQQESTSRNSSPTSSRPQELLFASSKLFNSPDPSALPIPKFDEFLTTFDSPIENVTMTPTTTSTTIGSTKTHTLRQFLNIRQSITA